MKKFIILFLVLLNAQLFAQVPEPVNNQNQPCLPSIAEFNSAVATTILLSIGCP